MTPSSLWCSVRYAPLSCHTSLTSRAGFADASGLDSHAISNALFTVSRFGLIEQMYSWEASFSLQ